MIYKVREKNDLMACKWAMDNYEEICEFLGYQPKWENGWLAIGPEWDRAYLYYGDYVVKDKYGEIYVCLEKHFDNRYEIIG